MTIRQTTFDDLDAVMDIYDIARDFMRNNGNPTQWTHGYPSAELITGEIESGHSFVCIDGWNQVTAVFSFIIGDDPTYAKIYEGKWLNENRYGVIHRVASSGKEKGIMVKCLEWCFTKCDNIRIDTHPDNLPMRHILNKNGFIQCGIIYVRDNTQRIAFHRNI